ncbi:MAG: copper chaperone PCu(A)C [Clostridia bacterium]|nr:copper chaperone PCu(A)C [Clostridia bacterium]
MHRSPVPPLARLAAAGLALLLLAACSPSPASRAAGRLQVRQAWARAAEAGQNGAVYLTVENAGGEADRLLEVSTDVAARAEIHRSRMVDGVMQMEPVRGGLAVPADQKVVFAPGGYHVMLFGLRRTLAPGDRFQLTLRFARAGTVRVPVEVRSAASGMPGM